jgi:DNA-binding transcriptional MerR regulator
MQATTAQLPAIPAKRYFTIGEVSELCGVKPYVLRYWEQEFTQLRPMKRRGNRRYYQHHEVLLIRRIRELLYDQGFTISGARNRLHDGREPDVESTSTNIVSSGDDVAPWGAGEEGVEPLEPQATFAVAQPRLNASAGTANQATYLAAALDATGTQATISVWPSLPENPSASLVRAELMAIRDLLAI